MKKGRLKKEGYTYFQSEATQEKAERAVAHFREVMRLPAEFYYDTRNGVFDVWVKYPTG